MSSFPTNYREGFFPSKVIINSYDRFLSKSEAGKPSYCRIPLPAGFNDVSWIRLFSFSYVNSFYVFQNTKNNFISYEEPAGGGIVNFSLTPGTYTVSEIQTWLQAQLNSTSPNGYTYIVSVDENTKKFTISSTNNFVLDFSGTGTMWYELGFNNEITSPAISHTSQRTYDLAGPRYIYIQFKNSEIATTSYMTRAGRWHFIIPINAGYGEIDYFEPSGEFFENVLHFGSYTDLPGFGDLGFYIFTDRINRDLDRPTFNGNDPMNGADWILGLEITHK